MVADTANSVFAAMLTPSLEQQIVAPDGPAPSTRRSDKREVIIARNLFNASTLAPPPLTMPEPEPEEDLEESRLPLKLLGTAASSNPALSHAAVENTRLKQTVVVKINDDLERIADLAAKIAERAVRFRVGGGGEVPPLLMQLRESLTWMLAGSISSFIGER